MAHREPPAVGALTEDESVDSSHPARTAWLITGLPGAGKTTVARLLAGTFPRSVHLEGDALAACIVRGVVWANQEPQHEAHRQQRLVVRNHCLLARSYAAAGFVPVMEYIVTDRERLERYRRALEGLELRFVVLHPGKAVALARDRNRPAHRQVAHFWTHLEEIMLRELRGIGLWVESGGLSAEETVQVILRDQDRARVGG